MLTGGPSLLVPPPPQDEAGVKSEKTPLDALVWYDAEGTPALLAGAVAIAARRLRALGASDDSCVRPLMPMLEAALLAAAKETGGDSSCPFKRLSRLVCAGLYRPGAIYVVDSQQSRGPTTTTANNGTAAGTPKAAAAPLSPEAAVLALATARQVRTVASEAVAVAAVNTVAKLTDAVGGGAEPRPADVYAAARCVGRWVELQATLELASRAEKEARATLRAERARRNAVHARVVATAAAQAAATTTTVPARST